MCGGYTRNSRLRPSIIRIDVATGNVAALAAAPADRDQPGTKDLIGRVTLKWTPTENLTNTLKISGTHSRGGASGFSTILGCAGPFGQRNPSLRCGAKFTTYFNDMPIEYKGATGLKDNKLYSDYDSFAVNDTLNYELNDDVTFTSVTNFNRNKVRYLQDYGQESDAGVWAAINSKFRAFSNESRVLTSFDGPVNLLFGTYYQSSKRDHGEFVTFIGVINSAASAADKYLAFTKISATKGETISAFGQAIWKIVPEVELTAGARYTHETKKSTYFQPYEPCAGRSFHTADEQSRNPSEQKPDFQQLVTRSDDHLAAFKEHDGLCGVQDRVQIRGLLQ
ncbi:MAG: TonB-dependent receptor [Sphingomonadales bacterium]|nr:TonB-dependent receptor [Sphingomonadales bacterium]